MLLAITSEGKLGLGILAGAFIVFALLSSFYFPRRNPDFPGNRLGLFVLVRRAALRRDDGRRRLLREGGGRRARRRGDRDARHRDRRGAATTTETHCRARPRATPAAGEAVFASAGCGGCHTLEAAGSSGNVGPNLDEAKPDHGARRRAGHERHGRDALVPGPARREADPGRRRVRGRLHAGVAPPRYPVPRPERCPSGRRSATGNRVRVERRVAGSNPALSAAGCFENPARMGRVLDCRFARDAPELRRPCQHDRPMPQQTLHTQRLTLMPLADEHLEWEVAARLGSEVMRYLTGRASTREEVAAGHARRLAAAQKVDGLGFWVGLVDDEFVGWWILQPATVPTSPTTGGGRSRLPAAPASLAQGTRFGGGARARALRLRRRRGRQDHRPDDDRQHRLAGRAWSESASAYVRTFPTSNDCARGGRRRGGGGVRADARAVGAGGELAQRLTGRDAADVRPVSPSAYGSTRNWPRNARASGVSTR